MKRWFVLHRRETEEDIFARYALGHGQGLLFAYAVTPGAPPRELSVPEAEAALAAGRGLVWLHLDLTTTPAKRWIETQSWLPGEAKEMLTTREDHTQYRLLDHGIAGILRDFHRELEEVDWRVGQLHFYADEHRLVTARRHPLAGLDRAQQMLLRGVEDDSGVALLALIIEALADLLDEATDKLGHDIERVEDRVEAGEAQHLRAGLGELRIRAILFRRQIHGERRVMARLGGKPPPWFRESDAARLREVIEHLSATAEELDTIEVRAKLLQDELAARLAEATNRNLFVLSVISAVLLPMTLVAGLFGMNLGGMPGLDSPQGFWGGTALVLVIGLAMIAILRWRRIL